MPTRESRCSAGEDIQFVWAGNPVFTGATSFDRAVKAFSYAIMQVPDLHWEPQHLGITRREFRDRIVRGSHGRLAPVTQVAEIDRAASEFVFENKYDFPVVEIRGGIRSAGELKSRFYISEPPALEDHFVGLHVYVKTIIPNDHTLENQKQNTEIDVAIQYYDAGRDDQWGIKE